MAAIIAPLIRVLRESTRERIGILDECRIPMRVMPWDCDINLHLNNSRYLEAMDTGRYALVVRTGMLRPALKEGWRPVVASARVRFRRSLEPFEAFDLVTRIVGWDDDYYFIEQRFETRDREGVVHLAASGYVRGVFFDRHRKRVSPRTISRLVMGREVGSPPIPKHLQLWLESDELIRVRRKAD